MRLAAQGFWLHATHRVLRQVRDAAIGRSRREAQQSLRSKTTGARALAEAGGQAILLQASSTPKPKAAVNYVRHPRYI